MIIQLLTLLGLRKKVITKKDNTEGKTIGSYEIIADGLGFYDIKIGDMFEGAACGNWFGNQTCVSVNGEYVHGTTTLVTFRKEMIRPIKQDNVVPFIQTHGIMNDCKSELSKSLKLEAK